MSGSSTKPESAALWDALGQYGPDGTIVAALAALHLPGFVSESSVRKALRGWESTGHVVSIRTERTERFIRADAPGVQDPRKV